ncbi:hypothetical protein [Natronorubrum thiooxidans]|nr:hypothetical protein [Natronorubrum thiooxidans]
MSRIATRSESNATNSLEEIAVDLPDGRTARVEITGLPTNHARVDVRIPNGRRWIFGVNGDIAGLVMVLNQNGQRVDDELPTWIEPVIQRTGLKGIDS